MNNSRKTLLFGRLYGFNITLLKMKLIDSKFFVNFPDGTYISNHTKSNGKPKK